MAYYHSTDCPVASDVWAIRSLTKAILQWTAEIEIDRHLRIAKSGFNPSQPRVPEGNPNGGEWTDTGGGAGSTLRNGGGRFKLPMPPKNPLLRPVSDPSDTGRPRTRPRNPMDTSGGPRDPRRGNNGGLTDAELEVLAVLQQQQLQQ